jgi:hypothetical protein
MTSSRELLAIGMLSFAVPGAVTAAPTTPGLAVELRRTVFAKGEPVTVTISHQRMPRPASVVVTLLADHPYVPGGERLVTGPLVMESIPLKGAGRTTVVWDGRRVACAPGDMPQWCDGVDIGRYRIRASVYDTGRFTTVGWPPWRRPKLLAEADSPALYLEGSPDFSRLHSPMTAVAARWAREKLGIDRVKTYAATWSELKAASPVLHGPDGYCMKFDVAPPATGRVTVCAPDSILSRDGLRTSMTGMSASGRLGWRWGVVDYQGAIAAALRVASPKYFDRVRSRDQSAPGPRGTYLMDVVQDIRFRPDLNVWLVEVAEIEAGGNLPESERFTDRVLVQVGAGGMACVISTTPYNGGLRYNLRTDRVAC